MADSLPGSLAGAGWGHQSEGNWLRGDEEGQYDSLFANEDEEQPTQKVPLAAMLAGSGTPEEPADEDLEEFPTAEMKAAYGEQQPSRVTPPFGTEIVRETHPQHTPANSPMPAVPQSGSAGSGELAEIPANHSLDQLWAPVRPLANQRMEVPHSPDADAIRATLGEMGLGQEEPEVEEELEVEEEKPVMEPVDSDNGLEASFAPWRDDSSWQPPALPRYGPPLSNEANPETEPNRQQRERTEFSEDEFLR
jgi:hypothetical protein